MKRLLEPGAIVGSRFQLGAPIGKGGMGLVFEANDAQTGARVAVKLIRPDASDPSMVERFRREAELTAKLQSPHVVRVLAHGEDDGNLFLAMELLDGITLREALEEGTPLAWSEAVGMALDVALGLAEAHAVGIVHRDVKPANIVLCANTDGSQRAVLLDFGIARSLDASATMTATGFVVGTAGYIAPEVAMGGLPFDARADLYSLGMVLYEALVGAPPFVAANPLALAARQAGEDPRPPHERERDVPPAVSRLVMRLASRDPARRPRSARALVDELRALAEGHDVDDNDTLAEPAPELMVTDHVRLEHKAGTTLVRLVRTSVPYAAAADIGESYALLHSAFPLDQRSALSFLLDVRAAPMRTDPRFEKIVAEEVPRLYQGWRRAGVLAATHAGVEQLARIRERAGVSGRSFLDEQEALAWLLEDS